MKIDAVKSIIGPHHTCIFSQTVIVQIATAYKKTNYFLHVLLNTCYKVYVYSFYKMCFYFCYKI